MNHEELALALSDSLERLCEDIAHWRKQLKVHGDIASMRSDICALYVVVFEFLTEVFTMWSSSGLKRFFRSFDKNAIDKLFLSKQAKIKRLTEKLDRAAELATQARVQKFGAKLEDLVTKADLEAFLLQLGSQQQRFLQELDLRRDVSPARPAIAQSTPSLLEFEPQQVVDQTGIIFDDEHRIHRKDLLSRLKNADEVLLEPIEQMRNHLSRTSHFEVDREVMLRLREWTREWTRETQPRILWIQGPSHVPKPSQNTLTAIAVTAAAKESGMSVLAYFCSSGSEGPETAPVSLRNLVSYLIVQHVALLPETLSIDHDLSASRIVSCMGVSNSLSESIQLLYLLRRQLLQPIVYVLDGLEALEDRSDAGHTRNLLEFTSFLCNNEDHSESGSCLRRTCITTDGYVDALAATLQERAHDIVRYELEADAPNGDDVEQLAELDMGRDI